MVKSNYDYYVYQGVLCIEDLNLRGGMSVTNDIENVVKEIHEKCTKVEIPDMIIYRDSDLMWDGWDHKKEEFIYLQVEDIAEAVKLIKEYYN